MRPTSLSLLLLAACAVAACGGGGGSSRAGACRLLSEHEVARAVHERVTGASSGRGLNGERLCVFARRSSPWPVAELSVDTRSPRRSFDRWKSGVGIMEGLIGSFAADPVSGLGERAYWYEAGSTLAILGHGAFLTIGLDGGADSRAAAITLGRLAFSRLGGHAPAPAPVPHGDVRLAPFPLTEEIGAALSDQPVAYLKSRTAAGLSARVDWGDGSSSTAAIRPAPAGIDRAGDRFEVVASHTYTAALSSHLTVTVRAAGGVVASARAEVSVEAKGPKAFFVPNPTNAHQDGISLFTPQLPGPGQDRIVSYRWDFGDDLEHPLIDNARRDPQIKRVLDGLQRDPGDPFLRAQGVALGILPGDSGSGAFGLGGWSSDQVRQLVGIWQAYFFRSHVVPHAFDYFNSVGVRLTVVDAHGRTSQYVQNYKVSRDCRPWGGPLSAWFRGYTTCDTYNGIAVQFGPHRPADYITVSLGGPFGSNASLTLVRPVHTTDRVPLLAGVQLGKGIGPALPVAGAQGWLGPPDPSHAPRSQDDVVNFVDQADLVAGGAAEIGQWGLGFYAVSSLTSKNPDGSPMVGEERPIMVGAQASLGLSCATPVENLGGAVEQLARKIYDDWSGRRPKPSPTALGADLQQLVTAIARSGVDLGLAVGKAIDYCAGVKTG